MLLVLVMFIYPITSINLILFFNNLEYGSAVADRGEKPLCVDVQVRPTGYLYPRGGRTVPGYPKTSIHPTLLKRLG